MIDLQAQIWNRIARTQMFDVGPLVRAVVTGTRNNTQRQSEYYEERLDQLSRFCEDVESMDEAGVRVIREGRMWTQGMRTDWVNDYCEEQWCVRNDFDECWMHNNEVGLEMALNSMKTLTTKFIMRAKKFWEPEPCVNPQVPPNENLHVDPCKTHTDDNQTIASLEENPDPVKHMKSRGTRKRVHDHIVLAGLKNHEQRTGTRYLSTHPNIIHQTIDSVTLLAGTKGRVVITQWYIRRKRVRFKWSTCNDVYNLKQQLWQVNGLL